jgi:hypothetical protein
MHSDWNLGALILLTVLSYQAGDRIRNSSYSAARAVGSIFLGIGWLGCALLVFLILINFIAPLVAFVGHVRTMMLRRSPLLLSPTVC